MTLIPASSLSSAELRMLGTNVQSAIRHAGSTARKVSRRRRAGGAVDPVRQLLRRLQAAAA